MTRLEWRLKKIHLPINLRFFEPALKVLNIIIIVVFSIYYINKTYGPYYHFQEYTLKKELKRQEEYIKASQERELKENQLYFDRLRLKEKYKKEKLKREEETAEIEACAKKYKIGDRIKIFDMNAPMVKEGDHYRFSIGGIAIITNIIGTTLYCDSGEQYSFGVQIDKVQSNREWRDLVNMSLRGELKFTADNNYAP